MEHLDQRKKITIMAAIVAAMLFASLNQTIVGTALPKIISELGGMEYYSWIFTVYMLTSSITTILVGKLSDIYGRKPFLLIGIAVFLVGSFMNGLSNTVIQLIMYRGIQGIGGGMIMSTAYTAIGDLFSPRERGRWMGLMSAAFGLASVFGPTLGGYIVDHAPWHWVFWVFLPFGIVAFVMILILFPRVERKPNESVDYFGSLFLTLTMVPMLLAFSWAGSKYEWGSTQIISLLAGAAVALVIFILVERKVKTPVLPLTLFKNDIFSLSNLINFIMGAGMFGAIMYMPYFVQGVMGTSATHSGYVTMPMTLSLVLGSALSGQIISRTGKYKLLALFGMTMMTAGMLLMVFMNTETTTLHAILNMIVLGLGLGLGMPVFSLTIQNAVEPQMLGVATASSQLFRSLGGTIGVAVMGTIMSHRMASKMKELFAGFGTGSDTGKLDPQMLEQLKELQNPQILLNQSALAEIQSKLPPEVHTIFDQMIGLLREAMSFSLSGVFLTGTIIVAVSVLLTFFLREIPLRTAARKVAGKKADPQEENKEPQLS